MNLTFQPYPFDYIAGSAPATPGRRSERIVIVGGGIGGLTLALGLATQGVRSVVIEADSTVCTGSRAVCFSRRSLEIFQRLGVLEPMLAKGLPWEGGRSHYGNTEVLHFRMPNDRLQQLPPMINLQQYHLEEFLVQALHKHGDLADIRWQSRCAKVDPHGERVRLAIESATGNYDLDAEWVVACDGGRSVIRDALGLRLAGTAYEGRYVVVDIALECDLPTERLAWFDPPSNPGSTILMHKQPDGIWRVDYQLSDDEDGATAIQPQNVLPRVQAHLEMIGQTGKWAPIWISLYKANALTLDRYRHGRFLFVGDAAHLVPIFGVRGANSTIDDADNLAWKLAHVVDGHADERLLDSYSDERVQAAGENLVYGRKSTQFMAPPDFAFQTMRTAVLQLAVDTPAIRPLINPRQTTPIRYADSPLNAPPSSDDDFAGGPAIGAVLPSCPVEWISAASRRAGFLADALVPGEFTLLHFAASGPVPDALAHAAARAGATGVGLRIIAVRGTPNWRDASHTAFDAEGHAGRLFAAREGTVYLVRPDGHVLGRWRSVAEFDETDRLAQCLGGGTRQGKAIA